MAQAKNRRGGAKGGKGGRGGARVDRRDQPPTWKGAARPGASLFAAFLLPGLAAIRPADRRRDRAPRSLPRSSTSRSASTPRQYFYNRRQVEGCAGSARAQRSREERLIPVDVRSFTVGPSPRTPTSSAATAPTGPDRRPRRRGRSLLPRSRSWASTSRRSCSPTPTSTTSARSRRWRRRPGRRSTVPRSRSRARRHHVPSCRGRGSARSRATTPTRRLRGGEQLELAGFEIDVALHARAQPRPRHLRDRRRGRRRLFSGDVLFQGSVGRIDLPGGDWGTLLESIRTLVDSYPEETVVYPGHMGITTLGRRARHEPVPG